MLRGDECCARVFVPHPISDQTDAQLHAKARGAVDEIVAALLHAPVAAPAADTVADRAADAECGA